MSSDCFQRTIDWKQGLAIALGVPLLILPSIGTFATYLWAFAIVAWGLSVIQGFFQNMAYGELSTMFPNASGLPGFAQAVFGGEGSNWGKFIGGFSAWGYWFAWNPVLSIYSVLIGSYLKGIVPALSHVSILILSVASGIIIFSVLILVNLRSISSGATLGYILAFISLIPLFIICLAPFFTGDFHLEYVTSSWFPTDWRWDISGILIFLGVMATAQWSACAWETAAIYGPEYKEPKSDVPKALFSCGIICLVTYVFVQTSVTGTLGIEGILEQPISPLLPMAQKTLGSLGSTAVIIILLAAMILIIQTAFNGSARSMHSMAQEGNLPSFFGKLTQNGTPLNSMIVIALFNLVLIVLFTSIGETSLGPASILSASAIGYIVANSISLAAYFKARNDLNLKKINRPFRAPDGWKYVALFFSILNIPFYLIGILYLNSIDFGWGPVLMGFVVLLCFVPLWLIAQKENKLAHEVKILK